jgi:hypothetical protein
MLLCKRDYLGLDERVTIHIWMNAVLAQESLIIALFEKCLTYIDYGSVIFLANFPYKT